MSGAGAEAQVKSLRYLREGRLVGFGAVAGVPAALLLLFGPLAWFSSDALAAAVLFGVMGAIGLWTAMLAVPLGAAALSSTHERGRLVATFSRGEGLRVAGISIPTDELALAWARGPTQVEVLTQAGNELTLELEDPTAAAALVAAIRTATSARRAYPVALEGPGLRLMRKTWSWLAPLTVALGFLWAGPAYVPALGIAAALGWLGSKGTRRVHFGADGVRVEGRFRKRYVPYADILGVSVQRTLTNSHAVRLILKDGRSVSAGSLVGHERANLVRALIEEGVAMFEAGSAAGAHVAELERGALDPTEWRARVESAGKARGYRGAAIDHERLLTLMRNPAATSAQRVAAALALRADEGGVARIRVAAEVSAEPSVREAFEELAADELDEVRLEKALRRLEAGA